MSGGGAPQAHTGALVRVARDGPVTSVQLHRPDRLNAVTEPLLVELREVLQGVGADEGCRAVVLSGAGRAFCAGLDLVVGVGEDVPTALRVMRTATDVIGLLRGMPQPVVAAVAGHAVGAGFALAAACDVRIVAPDAVFSAPFVDLGMSAGDLGLTWLLPRQIGASAAAQLLLTGGRMDADRAVRAGFASESVDDPVAAALDVAHAIAAAPEIGVRETKRLLDASTGGDGFRTHLELELRTQVLCAFAGGLDEARARFAARRRPAAG